MDIERYQDSVLMLLRRAGWEDAEMKNELHVIFHAFQRGVTPERCAILMDLFHVPVTLVARRQGAG